MIIVTVVTQWSHDTFTTGNK